MSDKEVKSIVPEKYRGDYKGAQDWLTDFIDGLVKEPIMKTVKVKDEEGKVTGEEQVPSAKTVLNLDKLFGLATANHIDVAKYEEQRDRPNAAGRLRMTIGNSLRAAAKHRHGLFDLDGEWIDAPEDFLDGAERTQERDGTKIAKAKPETAETEDA